MKKTLIVLVVAFFAVVLQGGPIQETIEAAAKLSGKMLSTSSRKTAEKILSKAVQKYGDDALKIVKHGGIEAVKQGAKYGDDFWRLARHASPQAARSLALHADELMPIAKRLGTSFVKLESKVPGLASKVVAEFGDDTARHLAKHAAPNDISKLLGLASRADSPATKKLLLEKYRKGGSTFLKNLDSKKIMVAGLTASMVITAYKISDGIETGIEKTAEKNPNAFKDVVNNLTFPIKILFVILVILFVWPVFRVWNRFFFLWKPKQKSATDNNTTKPEQEQEQKQVQDPGSEAK